MKKLLLFIATIIAFGGTAFAQKSKSGAISVDPPTSVEQAFTKKYTLAKKPIWTAEEENYRVDFKYNDVKMGACYSGDGKMLYTEKELSKAQHNKVALKYIEENYAGYKVISMKKRDTYDKKTTYVAMLRKIKELLEVEFDKKGGFIRDADKTPVSASKKKNKKDEDEESMDEEKPVKKDAKVKKSKGDSGDNEDEEAAPAAKPEKAKIAPKKTNDDEEEEAAPVSKPEKAKATVAPKKATNDDEDDEADAKPETKKEKAKPAPAPKKEKKKKTEEEEEDE